MLRLWQGQRKSMEQRAQLRLSKEVPAVTRRGLAKQKSNSRAENWRSASGGKGTSWSLVRPLYTRDTNASCCPFTCLYKHSKCTKPVRTSYTRAFNAVIDLFNMLQVYIQQVWALVELLHDACGSANRLWPG